MLNDTWSILSLTSSSRALISPAAIQSTIHRATTQFLAGNLHQSKNMAFYALPVLLAYLLLVKTLRFRRIDKLQKQYSTASLASMTDREAWGIQKSMMELEFPFTFYKSLQFALFRTYGIPTISKTLTKTQLFANPLYSFKRYADTVLLIGEFTSHDPTSERTRIAIARTNFIHSPYLQSGAITPEDMLYTLSLFATEPLRFIDLYEWRSTTTLERCAMGVFWKSVGDALGIDYAGYLPSASKGFRDGNHWLQEVTAWAQEYEAKAMVPAQSNRETAEQTTALLTYVLPPRLKLIGEWFVSHMMDDRLRRAMIYDPAPGLANVVFSASFSLRKFILRYLTLPRPEFLRSLSFSEKPDPVTGTYHLLSWSAQPFYVKPTLWNRWLSPAALLFRILGLPVPGDQGDTFFPNGYHLDNVGPNTFSGKGKDFMEKQIKILEVERRGQCPFH